MTEIHATKGKVFIVDDEFAYLMKYKWHAIINGHLAYARRSIGPRRFSFLHVEIAGAEPGQKVDHKNGDTGDCRRMNLRVCTQRQNCQNRRVRKDNRIGIKGIRAHNGGYTATIFYEGRAHHLGTFKTPQSAAAAYDLAAHQHFGEFAKTNEGMRREAQ